MLIDVFCKNFEKLTKKHLCQGLLLNKVISLRVINTKLMILLQNLFYQFIKCLKNNFSLSENAKIMAYINKQQLDNYPPKDIFLYYTEIYYTLFFNGYTLINRSQCEMFKRPHTDQ